MNEVQVMITAETLEKILDTPISETSVLDLVMALKSVSGSSQDEIKQLTEEISRLNRTIECLCAILNRLDGSVSDLNYLLNSEKGGFIDTLKYP